MPLRALCPKGGNAKETPMAHRYTNTPRETVGPPAQSDLETFVGLAMAVFLTGLGAMMLFAVV